jgi:hypothetical protein
MILLTHLPILNQIDKSDKLKIDKLKLDKVIIIIII